MGLTTKESKNILQNEIYKLKIEAKEYKEMLDYIEENYKQVFEEADAHQINLEE